MLNIFSDSEAAANARTPFGMGACLPPVAVRTAQPRQGAIAFARPRPRAFWAADVFGQRHPSADRAMALGQPNASKQNYPYTTRTAASGGAKGPHPAREPVPV
jgi:hypothetical protein